MTSPVRIAFLTTEYPTERVFTGGLAAYVQRVAHALLQAGHEPEVFTLSDRTERTRDGPVLVHRVTEAQCWGGAARRIPFAWRFDDFLELAASALALTRALRLRHREAPFGVVQASNFRAPGLVVAVRPVAPLVTRISSIEILWRRAYARPPSAAVRLQGWAEAWQVRHSAAAYAPSHLLAAAASEAFGRTVRVIEPPFAVDQLARAMGPPPAGFPPGTYALFFGSIGLLKGCDRLVRVLPHILQSRPDFRFVFVGRVFRTADGEPFDAHIARALGPYGMRVVVLAERPRAELFPLVAGARVVVLPSRVDNLPNACLEAMALERVVVATKGASFEQLIDNGESGFLVPQEDDGALETGILEAWDLPAESRRLMGRAAQERIGRLDPRLTIVPLEALFAEVTGGR